MKFAVLGTSQFTLQCAQALLDSHVELCVLISMSANVRPDNSTDVAAYAEREGIPYREFDDINSWNSLNALRGYGLDYILCSWPKILGKEILQLPKFYCIGSHPTELPFNRGRHPLHWIVALGISRTALSFFRMDEGIDSGNLLLQIPFEISSDDSTSDVVNKMNSAAYNGTIELCRKFTDNPSYNGVSQDQLTANYWRRRTPHDVTLDLRMSSSMIMRTVRSFAPPYSCANLIYKDHIMKIISARVSKTSNAITGVELQRMEPGKIIHIEGNIITIKVDDAIMDLECRAEVPTPLYESDYLHPPSKYLVGWADEQVARLL